MKQTPDQTTGHCETCGESMPLQLFILFSGATIRVCAGCTQQLDDIKKSADIPNESE